jgi:outer membrane lipoprotein carrier protein
LEACKRTGSGKSSPRHLRPSTKHALLFALVAAGGAWAQPAGDGATATGLATLEAFLTNVHSFSADFRQELWTADQRLIETETGTLSLKRPNRFRWSYLEPTELLVVADGAQLWMYDVELAQVTVAPLDETVGSSPAMLLSGDREVRDGFDVVQTYPGDGLEWIKLVPKADGTDFTSILIGLNGNAPQSLELVDGLNQVTRIEFVNVVVNPELPDALFELKPPPGVDIIGGED